MTKLQSVVLVKRFRASISWKSSSTVLIDPDKSEELKSRTASKNVKESRFFKYFTDILQMLFKDYARVVHPVIFFGQFLAGHPTAKEQGKKI